MEKNAEQPAYPFVIADNSNNPDTHVSAGLTKRELIAAMILQGLAANHVFFELSQKINPNQVADFYSITAIEQADSLLTQLQNH